MHKLRQLNRYTIPVLVRSPLAFSFLGTDPIRYQKQILHHMVAADFFSCSMLGIYSSTKGSGLRSETVFILVVASYCIFWSRRSFKCCKSRCSANIFVPETTAHLQESIRVGAWRVTCTLVANGEQRHCYGHNVMSDWEMLCRAGKYSIYQLLQLFLYLYALFQTNTIP